MGMHGVVEGCTGLYRGVQGCISCTGLYKIR